MPQTHRLSPLVCSSNTNKVCRQQKKLFSISWRNLWWPPATMRWFEEKILSEKTSTFSELLVQTGKFSIESILFWYQKAIRKCVDLGMKTVEENEIYNLMKFGLGKWGKRRRAKSCARKMKIIGKCFWEFSKRRIRRRNWFLAEKRWHKFQGKLQQTTNNSTKSTPSVLQFKFPSYQIEISMHYTSSCGFGSQQFLLFVTTKHALPGNFHLSLLQKEAKDKF